MNIEDLTWEQLKKLYQIYANSFCIFQQEGKDKARTYTKNKIRELENEFSEQQAEA